MEVLMVLKVEKNIDVPVARTSPRDTSESLNKLKEMTAGDSFFIDLTEKKEQRRKYNTIYRATKKVGIKVIVRFYPEGIRIWKA